MVQHLQMWDFISLSGKQEERYIEYVDQQHEHFENPAFIKNAHYQAPTVSRKYVHTSHNARKPHAPTGTPYSSTPHEHTHHTCSHHAHSHYTHTHHTRTHTTRAHTHNTTLFILYLIHYLIYRLLDIVLN